MSFLTEIKNFIKTEVLGIEEPNTATSVAQKKDNKPVIECKTEAPEDTFEKQTEGAAKTTGSKNGMSAKAMEETIANIPAATVNLKQMIKDGLLEKVTGLSKEMFDRLPAHKKKLVFDSVQIAVKRFEDLRAKGKVSEDANIEAIIVSDAANIYQAISTNAFKNVQEYEKASCDINKELGKDFDKNPKTERRAEFKRRRAEYKRRFKEELEEIRKLPREQQAAATQELIQRHKFIMRRHFLDVSAQRATETAVDATLLLDAEDIEYGAETVIETRSSKEEKTKAADYADYNFTKEVIQTNAEAGNKVSAETLKGYTETYMEYKSADAAYEYQANYTTDRTAFETALQKQQNGEKLTAEEQALLSFMSEEYYTASAQGIGQGALNNINMTTDQKADFLSVWENDAKQFSDYELVTSDVKKSMSEKPEYQEINEKFEQKQTELKETEGKTKQKTAQAQTETKETYEPEYSIPAIVASSPATSQNINTEAVVETEKTVKAEKPAAKTTEAAAEIKSNPVVIARDIKESGVEQAVKKYGSDAIQIILDYSGFKHLRPQLTTIIRSYNLNDLRKLTQNCSDSAFVYICSIVNGDFVETLKENRERTKGLCYSAANQVKKLEGEYAAV